MEIAMHLPAKPTVFASIALILLDAQGLSAADDDEQRRGTTNMTQPDMNAGVADLPYSRGKRFRTLDNYLAHLEQQGAIDLPWWREIRPGVYEHVIRMPEARREVATRAELMRRFGFDR
jgi:hypothetical protein